MRRRPFAHGRADPTTPLARWLLVAAVVVLAPALLGATALPAVAPTSAPVRSTAGLQAVPATTNQAVVVSSSGYATSYAVLSAWSRWGGSWHRVYGPVRARIGGNGFSTLAVGDRRQNTSTSPVGVYSLARAFGTRANPGAALPYRVVDGDDWWPYDPLDPSTYNVLQTSRSGAHWRTSWGERLASYTVQYRYAAVIGFNLPSGVHLAGGQYVADVPADTRRGGGIFLHVNGPGATAGCVSVSETDMVRLLRWLDPTQKPRIVMGPATTLARL